jgi:hypothetical protein
MASITVSWPAEINEHGRPMLWFGSWLKGDDGAEGAWFYSGRGGERSSYSVPAWATGVRIRRWPNEGFDAEYADLFVFEHSREVAADSLDFETRQRFSRLVV